MLSKLDKDVKKLKTENNIQLSRNELSSKLQIDNAKQTVFIELKKEAKQKLATMASKKDAKYKTYLESSFKKALDRLNEKKLEVKICSDDKDMMEKIISSEKSCTVTISKESLDIKEVLGGYVLQTLDEKIFVDMTLVVRLDQACDKGLPALRSILFSS